MTGLSGEHPGVLEGKKLMMRLLQFLFQNGYTFFFPQIFVFEEFVFVCLDTLLRGVDETVKRKKKKR